MNIDWLISKRGILLGFCLGAWLLFGMTRELAFDQCLNSQDTEVSMFCYDAKDDTLAPILFLAPLTLLTPLLYLLNKKK